jgi:hypothetical protein
MYRVCEEQDISSAKDPKLRIHLAKIWRNYPETLQATRRRDRIAMRLAAIFARG